MNSKYSIPLILAGLVLVAAVVFWPRDNDAEWNGGDGTVAGSDAVAEADTSGDGAAGEDRQRIDTSAPLTATDASLSGDEIDADAAEVEVVINGQRAGYPLAFTWRTGLTMRKTVLSDSFGRLRIPNGLKGGGELELPKGLAWAQPLSALKQSGDFEKSGMSWDPQQPLAVLDLKRLPGWHGRVIAADAKESDIGVANAEVTLGQSREKNPEQTDLRVSWQFQGGRYRSSTNNNVETDEAGNYFASLLDRQDGRMVEVDVAVRKSPVPGYAEQSWREEDLPADGWLGALKLETGVPVSIRVLDPEGIPVANAKLFSQNESITTADAAGVYRFKSLRQISSNVTATVDGFLPASLKLEPPFAQTPYEIHLQPTTRLVFEIDTEEYPFSTTPQLMIRAGGDPDIVDVDGKSMNTMRVTVGSMYSTMFSSGAEPGSTVWRSKIHMSNGKVVMTGVRKDLPLTAELIGPLGPLAIVEVPPREEGEQVIQLELENEGRELFGKVLNAEGLPLVGASVYLSDPDGYSARKSTSLDGSFNWQGVTLTEVGMTVSLDGYVEHRQELFTPANEGNLGEIVLHQARKLRVRFMHPDGTSGPAGMSVKWSNEEDSGNGTTRDKGYMVVEGLAPHLPIDLNWSYGGIPCEYRINVGEDKVRIPLPAVGKLKVVFSDTIKSQLGDDTYLCLQEQGSPAPTVDHPNGFCIGLRNSKTFNSVAVGDYRVCMYRLTGSGEQRRLEQVGQPSRVQLTAGQSTEVLLTD